ncbi:MAG: UvrB/UvrC motif-containing protein, partial [Clostridiales bacterium]|nr:UvrB/UvrC motif-containing protein [Clostridiales bacterium]
EIDRLRSLMATASKELDFESAIQYRDKIAELRELQRNMAKAKALRNKKS